ncbi:MAG: helix-turn-helix domain-containing protein [Clostridiales bacterium]|nr:helix-turn-helix domain-containing protein [Clostridiales bacterium]
MTISLKIVIKKVIFMVTLEKIQKAIIEAIRQSGIKQAELGEKIGVSQSTIAHYLRGRILPSLDTLSRLCTVLDLDANEILCVERPKDY